MTTGKGIFGITMALLLGWGGAIAQCDSTLLQEVELLTKLTTITKPLVYENKKIHYISNLSFTANEDGVHLIMDVDPQYILVCLNEGQTKAYMFTYTGESYPLVHTGYTNCIGILLTKLSEERIQNVRNLEVIGIKIETNGDEFDFILSDDDRKHLVCRLDAITGNYD